MDSWVIVVRTDGVLEGTDTDETFSDRGIADFRCAQLNTYVLSNDGTRYSVERNV
jgi:hypothetical protein